METSYEPLYQKIYNDIREKIKSGALPLGTKVPTEFELMEQYSVSRITTARALTISSGSITRFGFGKPLPSRFRRMMSRLRKSAPGRQWPPRRSMNTFRF